MKRIFTISIILMFVLQAFAFSTSSAMLTIMTDNEARIQAGPPCFSCDDTTYPWEDDDPETPWGIERVFDGNYYGDQYTTTVQVAILDTGIDLDHPDLVNNIAWAVDASGNGDAEDKNGHGTHVSGTVGAVRNNEGVVGVYANVELYAIKIGNYILTDAVNGVYLAMQGPDGVVGTDDDADVISMSFGSSSPSSDLHDALIEAYNSGITLVASAGNDGDGDGTTDEINYPAAFDEVIAVGATEKDDSIASFSNSGPYLDFAAPGRNIYSTYKNGGYDTLSGTSMACPHVSGMVALYLAMGGTRDPQSAYDWLKSNALDLGPSGWDTEFGWGLIQAP